MKRQDDIDNQLLKAFAITRLFPVRMNGYIGAGTGSLIIQAVIALTVGGLFALKIYWRRIKAFFLRKKVDAGGQPLEEAGLAGAAFAEVEQSPIADGGTESLEAALLPETVAVTSESEPAESGAVEGEESV